MMRSKYWEYPEYHTSLDDLDSVVTPVGLAGGFALHRLAVEILERNSVPTTRVLGEPQLGRRGLYSTLGAGRVSASPVLLLDVLSFCDGKYSTLEIARIVGRSFFEVADAVDLLASHDLVDVIPTFA
jgi:aminopeptidase-like protein